MPFIPPLFCNPPTDGAALKSCSLPSAYCFLPTFLPPHRLPLILFLQPFFQRGKVVADGRGVHFPLAGQGFKGVGPGAAEAHCEHLGQARARFLVIVNRAAVERFRAAGGLGQSAMKLELQNVRQEIARVGNISRDVIFSAGVEVLLAARGGRGNALVLQVARPTKPGCTAGA